MARIPFLILGNGSGIDSRVRLVREDVQRNFCPLLLDVLNEESDLHGPSDLPSDGGHSRLVAKKGVHGDTVLDDQSSDGNQREHQHVQDEELLAARG